MRVVQHCVDEALQLAVEGVVLGLLVDDLHVGDDRTVKELPECLVLATEQLQEDRDHGGCGYHVLATHDFEAGDESHAHHGVQDREVLLEQVDHFSRQKRGDLLSVNARDVRHELEVIN